MERRIELSKSKKRLQDRLKKNEKSQNQFQNELMCIKKNMSKRKTKAGFCSTPQNKKYIEEHIAK